MISGSSTLCCCNIAVYTAFFRQVPFFMTTSVSAFTTLLLSKSGSDGRFKSLNLAARPGRRRLNQYRSGPWIHKLPVFPPLGIQTINKEAITKIDNSWSFGTTQLLAKITYQRQTDLESTVFRASRMERRIPVYALPWFQRSIWWTIASSVSQDVQSATEPQREVLSTRSKDNPPITLRPPGQEALLMHLLPTEIILLIGSLLPTSGQIALGHTCRRLHSTFSTGVEDLFDRHHSSSETLARLQDQKVYKQIIKKSRFTYYFCNGCLTQHKSSDSSIQNLREPANARRCLKHEGMLWICPSKIWSYEETIGNHRRFSAADHKRPINQTPVDSLCTCKQHFYRNFDGLGVSAFPIKVFSNDTRITLIALFRALKLIHLRVCPHISISDSFVFSCFDAKCTRTFTMPELVCTCRFCRFPDFPEERACRKCSTLIRFRKYHNDAADSITIFLVVVKILDKEYLDFKNGLPWKNLVSSPSEVQRLKQEWIGYSDCLMKESGLGLQILSPDRDPLSSGYISVKR